VFERFTERARQVVVLAQDEARMLRHNYLGTEHLLLGLLREEEGLAARVLESLDIDVEEVRAQIRRVVGVGEEAAAGQIPFTPDGKKVLELALREAQSLSHNYIGTEHILLGLVRVDEGVGARVLLDFGAGGETIRNEIIRMLSGPGRRSARHPVGEPPPFVATTPPLAPEVAAEIDRVRTEKGAAIERQDFDQAAALRDRERLLVEAARRLMRVWEGAATPISDVTFTSELTARPMPYPAPGLTHRRVRREHHRRMWQAEALLVGWLSFGVAAGLGLLLAWLIWG
jgi:Clp amino terminal domain, pathogenicity island component/UvrB/uvrC motif